MIRDELNDALREFGLQVRGDATQLADGALFLIGSIGDEFFTHFEASPEYKESRDPLDKWSKRIIDGICATLESAEAIYPFDKPSPPFQQWAMGSDDVTQSPMGVLIHPQHGLWHAYRGAIKIRHLTAPKPPEKSPSPCDSCADKPCMTTCPVGAFQPQKYDVRACFSHLDSPDSAPCFSSSCLARKSCPVASHNAYAPRVAQFFMTHFHGTLQKFTS